MHIVKRLADRRFQASVGMQGFRAGASRAGMGIGIMENKMKTTK